MGKKKGRKKKRQKETDSEESKADTPNPTGGEDERGEFGGLPDRDLKKNLGCG